MSSEEPSTKGERDILEHSTRRFLLRVGPRNCECSVLLPDRPFQRGFGIGISEPRQYGTGNAKWHVIVFGIVTWFTPLLKLWRQPEKGVNHFCSTGKAIEL